MSLFNQLMGQVQPAQQAQNQVPQINPQAVASVKRMMRTLQGVNNPQQAIQSLASQNPQINQIMQMASGSGGLKNLFYQRAQQMGIDPNAILSQLK